jgi:hypothetical protein
MKTGKLVMSSTTLVRKWVWRCTAISLFLIVGIFAWRLLAASRATLTVPVPEMSGGRFSVASLETDTERNSSQSGKTLPVVYGFLPYWNLNHFNLNRVITHLAYFSFGLDAKGNFLENEPGYRGFYGETFSEIASRNAQAGNKNELVISLFNGDDIVSFLNCKKCQDNFYTQAVDMVRTNNLSGLNIDFEYLGEVTPGLRQNYTAFLKGLKGALARNNLSAVKISVDIYGEGASMYNLWEMEEMSEIVDYIVIMAYDYKTRRSSVPGPTAPILGKDDWGGDLLGSLQKLLEKVPPEKVILALPFYGYEWQVTELDLDKAKTFEGTGATLT